MGNTTYPSALRRLGEGSAPAWIGGIALITGGISTYWDIAAHVDGGRERFLTPPHIGIYVSVTVALLAILTGIWSDHRREGNGPSEMLRHPFRTARPGLAVAGAGMATALLAAPIDNAWHEIYGIDVTIWSPPHLLALMGIVCATLGLVATVPPHSAGRAGRHLRSLLLGGVLTGMLIATGEFEFDAPQYRIAFHPTILAAAVAFVSLAADSRRWGATFATLWFEVVRSASLVLLLLLNHSLPFVPIVFVSGFAVDVVRRSGRSWFSAGIVSSILLILINAPLLRAFGGITWAGDDLWWGSIGALIAGTAGAWSGHWVGDRVNPVAPPQRRSRVAMAMMVLALILTPGQALAHDVGGDAGSGTLILSPGRLTPGRSATVTVEDLEVGSRTVRSLTIEAWRAEHRLDAGMSGDGSSFSGEIKLPEEGTWLLLIRVETNDEELLSTRRLEVVQRHQTDEPLRHDFTLGVDTLAGQEPPRWLDVIAYGVSATVALALLRSCILSLRRLEDQSPREEAV